jgi:hypothetical protein
MVQKALYELLSLMALLTLASLIFPESSEFLPTLRPLGICQLSLEQFHSSPVPSSFLLRPPLSREVSNSPSPRPALPYHPL